jgi:probable phosphomutase (TIGR03848 family)
MSTVLLVRHGLTAMTGPVLAGRTAGVHLDDRGRAQAESLAQRVAELSVGVVVTSPLDRCQETADLIAAAQKQLTEQRVDERLTECDYGEWTGKPIKELARDPLWKLVQSQPSAVRFPGGESLREVASRAVQSIREWDARLGPEAVWVACSHGDVIKSILADALGLHLDQFQRIVVDPCSTSIVRYTDTRPYVLRANDIGGDLAGFAPPKRRGRPRKTASDATPGGGSGSGSI